MNRGSDHVRVDIPDLDSASMRPRFMNRGSQVHRPDPRAYPVGFNEAPIHESGKSPCLRTGKSP